MSIISYIFNLLPIQKEKVVLYSFTETYADQPKYIAEEILRRQLPWKLVWIAEHKRAQTPRGIRAVVGKYRSRFQLATARIIISNTRLGRYWEKGYRKKPGQLYLQTWHGSYGIKKMEADVHTPDATYTRKAKLDSARIDYLLSNSAWLTGIYRRSFYYTGPILEHGSPRNDLLFAPGDTAARVRRELGLPAETKLLLYAPTFRDGAESANPPMPDFTALRTALSSKFGGEWVILARLHPGRRKHPAPWSIRDAHVINASAYADIAELLVAADAMVSDYSSCLFDYMLTGKPAFIYAPDAADYETTRGLYYPLTDTPFPIALDFSSLLFNVESFNVVTYRTQTANFLQAKGMYDTGHAAEHIVDLLQTHLSGVQRCNECTTL